MRRLALTRKLYDLPLGRKLALLAAVYVLIGLVLLGLGYAGLTLLNGVRAYVGGEGIWSRNQKNAVYYLLQYTQTRDERFYQKFEESVASPKVLKRARLELEKPHFSKVLVAQSAIAGGLHPDDVDFIIFLFRWFRQVPFFADAVNFWERGDTLIGELENYAVQLRQELGASQPSRQRIAQIHQEIDKINSALSILEVDFSKSITRAAHLTSLILIYAVALVTLLLSVLGYVAYRSFSGHLLGGISCLRLGTERVAAGDFRREIQIQTADELGQLANAFNVMTQNIAAARLEIEDRNGKLARALHEQENLMASIPDIVYITDNNGMLKKWNRRTELVTGYSAQELAGKPGWELLTPEGETITREALNSWMQSGGFEIELPLQDKSGQVISYFWKGVTLKDENSESIGLIGIGRDITTYKRVQDHLDHLAHYDSLTGLANRSLLSDRLYQAVARAERHGGLLALVFIDLNNFKEINDTLGHDAGDSLLKTYSGWLKASLRGSDTAARWGGDEFVLILEAINHPLAVVNVLEKLFKHEATPLDLKGQKVFATSSVGISIYPLDGTDPLTLLKCADRAMYWSKERGGSSYKFASEHYDVKTAET